MCIEPINQKAIENKMNKIVNGISINQYVLQ